MHYYQIRIPRRSAIDVSSEAVSLRLDALGGPHTGALRFVRDSGGTVVVEAPESVWDVLQHSCKVPTRAPTYVTAETMIGRELLDVVPWIKEDIFKRGYGRKHRFKTLRGLLLPQECDETEPYVSALELTAAQLGEAVRSWLRPKRPTAFESHCFEAGGLRLWNYGRLIPELNKRFETNGVIRRVSNVVWEKAFTPYGKITLAQLLEEISANTYGGVWTRTEPKALERLLKLGEAGFGEALDLGSALKGLVHHEAEPIIEAAKTGKEVTRALNQLLTSLNSYTTDRSILFSLLLESKRLQTMVEDAARHSKTYGSSIVATLASALDLTSDDTVDTVMQKLKRELYDYNFQLAPLGFQDDIPDSDEIDVRLVDGTYELAKDLEETGCLLLTAHRDVAVKDAANVRYIMRVALAGGDLLGYIFLSEYFKTCYTWRINSERFKELYGKIRYRVSAIRKNIRVLEHLDVNQ